ncbi:unnamed protein product [Calicophoron daubneyi]|uniref:Protein kinase domain-containing protein n=1 Tax=Calicophoron daubneyi TaxID=300641 RepID=A0AAV2TI39_CALDB
MMIASHYNAFIAKSLPGNLLDASVYAVVVYHRIRSLVGFEFAAVTNSTVAMVSLGHKSPATLLDLKEKLNHAGENKSFSEDYQLGLEIGRGRFAKVCQVLHKVSGESRAAKIIRRWRNGKDTIDTILREIRVIELSQESKRIVRMDEYYLGHKDVVIILEHSRGGDFYHLLSFMGGGLPSSFVCLAVGQILDALQFLHARSIVHLDIKPENVLLRRPLPDCDVALCDFGLAKYLDKQQPLRDLVGTPDYVAPEILDYDPIQLTTDIWSVGAVTYFLLTGISPFWAPTKERTFENVCQLRICYPDDLFTDSSAVRFMKRLIKKSPRERPSAAECLMDPWFTKIHDKQEEVKRQKLEEPHQVDVPSVNPYVPVSAPCPEVAASCAEDESVRSELDRSTGES